MGVAVQSRPRRRPGVTNETWTTVSSQPSDDYLERVKAEIRAEADAARIRAPLPRRETPSRTTSERPSRQDGIDRARLDYAIAELTGPNYTAFVDNAFRALLKRAPDEPGLDAQVRLLGGGASKAEVLGNLRYSPEGRRIGTRVGGLVPRYALAKLTRVPVIGYFVEWGITLAGLPMLLRHQRAADTQVAAGFAAAAADLAGLSGTQQALGGRMDQVQQDLGGRLDQVQQDLGDARLRLEERAQTLESRTGTLESRTDELNKHLHDIPELRHYIHAINHWSVSLQRSIADIEGAADASAERADTLLAAMYDAPEAAAEREARFSAWFPVLTERLPATARVLDLGSGDGSWAGRLAERGADVSGIEANRFLAQRARERGLDVTTGDPVAALARCADASVDAITASSSAVGGGDALAEWFEHARRALKPGGWLLFGCAGDPRRFADMLRGRAGVFEPALARAALRAVGFAVDTAANHDVRDGVLAQRP